MRLGTKITNPGEIRTKITLQSRTVVQDAGGFSVPGWTTIAAVWSKWINAHGSDVLQAQIEKVDAPATVLIRYRSGVDTTCAVLKDSLRYEIISIDNIQERSEYLELKVIRMKAG
jgi:SPP1 family predicted phage head-tail adaptor